MNISQIRVVSLGWGVQSFTLAAMVAFGELDADYVVHCDTTWEKSATYRFAEKWGGWLVNKGVNLVTLTAKRSGISDNNCININIPAFTTDLGNNPTGMLRRQCTSRWKIDPIRRFVSKELKARGLTKKPGIVKMLLGISLDEWERMKDSTVKYIHHSYPLVDMRLTRADCIAYLERHGLEIPPKSSCVFCPYQSGSDWKAQKESGGDDWEISVRIDEAIREKRPGFVSYVHRSRYPLIELKTANDFGAEQLDMFTCDSGYCFM